MNLLEERATNEKKPKGLLMRAERLHRQLRTGLGLRSRAQKLSDEGRSRGLLMRAERLHRQLRTGLGLRSRAQKLSDEGRPRGLLMRAERLHRQLRTGLGLRSRAQKLSDEGRPQRTGSQAKETQTHKQRKRQTPVAEVISGLPQDADSSSLAKEKEKDTSTRSDRFQTLFAIIKELQYVTKLESFWKILSRAIVEELSAERIVVFSPDHSQAGRCFQPVYYFGFTAKPKWKLSKGKGLLKYLLGKKQVCSVAQIPAHSLRPAEKAILKEIQAKLTLSIREGKNIHAVALVCPGVYCSEQAAIEFLQILSELSLAGFKQIKAREESKEAIQELQIRTQYYVDIFHLAHLTAHLRNLSEFYDLLKDCLESDLQVISFSLVLLSPQEQNYYIFQAKGISEKSQEKYRLASNSGLIRGISNLPRIHYLSDFSKNEELIQAYTKKDLDKMQCYWILPLIQKNWLIGFITIHNVSPTAWTAIEHEIALSIAKISTPYLANLLIDYAQAPFLNDPFPPLLKRLEREFSSSQENSPLSVIDLRIQKLAAVSNALGSDELDRFFSKINRVLAKFLSPNDYLNLLEPGHFAILLSGKTMTAARQWLQEVLSRLPLDLPVKKKPKYKYRLMSLAPGSKKINKVLRIFK